MEWIEYDHDDLLCRHYLDDFLKQECYHNNVSEESIQLKKILDTGSMLIFIEDNKPIGMKAIVVEEESGIKFAKWPYRHAFNVNSTKKYFYSGAKQISDPYFFRWMYDRDIKHYIGTVNHYNFKMMRVVVEHHDRKIKDIDSYEEWEKYYILNANIHNKMILEKNVWSYAIFVSPDKKFFLEREEKPFQENFDRSYSWIK